MEFFLIICAFKEQLKSLALTAGRAVDCARVLAEVSLCPVQIVRGGFQRFSAVYLFLRTEKILYTITVSQNKCAHLIHTLFNKSLKVHPG